MSDNINTFNINTSAAVTAVNHSTSSPNQSQPSMNPGSSQWTQIARGEPVPVVSVPLSSSSSPLTAMIQPPVTPAVEWEAGEGVTKNVNAAPSGNAGKKPAWNKPSNVATESGSDMEAFIWPSLSGSTRTLNISSPDSSRDPLDGSSSTSFFPVSQGSRTVSASSSSQNQVRNNANSNANSIPNHTMPARQRSMNVSASNGGLSQPPPQGPMVEAPLNGPSSRDHIQRTGFGPYTGGNDQRNPRNSFRHRNSGPHPRGNGSHHLNHGGRRNQDHGNQDWSGRNFSNVHGYMLPRGGPSFVMHPPVPPSPPNTGPYLAPPHGRPMGYPEYPSQFYLVPAPHQESHRGVPPFQPIPLMFFPPEFQDYQLHVRIMDQIHYYFSNDNLIKDTYLRQHMDDHGWVPIKLIAGFRRVSHLTNNIQLILYALQWSTVVEVQGDKVRKRYDWMRWIIPSSFKFPTKSGQDMLVASFQNISLNQGTAADNQSGAVGSSSVDFNNQSQLFGNEGIAVDAQGGPTSSSN
ncbi:La related protein 1c [Hibiscus trionum]|uniref:La related protein 1c n=1 Tax=Hibiscus trionum TaxID=183268 RepID=A0A9W7GYS8_HIBTR|nr:La related protein 1c [Hibiscus trionum]